MDDPRRTGYIDHRPGHECRCGAVGKHVFCVTVFPALALVELSGSHVDVPAEAEKSEPFVCIRPGQNENKK